MIQAINAIKRGRLLSLALFILFVLPIQSAYAVYTNATYVSSKSTYPSRIAANNLVVVPLDSFAVAQGAQVKLRILVPAGINQLKFVPSSNTFQYGVRIGGSEATLAGSNGDTILLYDSLTNSTEHDVYIYVDNTQGSRTFKFSTNTSLVMYVKDDTAEYENWISSSSYAEQDYLTSKSVYPDKLTANLNTVVEINDGWGVAAGAQVKLKLLIPPGLNYVVFVPFSNSFQYGVKLGRSPTSVSTSNGDAIVLYNNRDIDTNEHFAYIFIDNSAGKSAFQLHRATKLTIKASDDVVEYEAWKSGVIRDTSDSNPIPEKPVLLNPPNNSILPATTKTITLQWSATSPIPSYNLRVENLTTGTTIKDARNNCPGEPLFICIDSYQATTIDISVEPGHQYRWWVHAEGDATASEANLSVFNIEQAVTQNSCVSEKLTQHLYWSRAIQNNMYSFRDQSLQQSKEGQHIIRLYYKHSEEVKSLIAKNWALRLMGFRLLLQMNYAIHPENKDLNVIPLNDTYSNIAHQFIDITQRYGSDQLNEDFEVVHVFIDELHGLTVPEIKAELNIDENELD